MPTRRTFLTGVAGAALTAPAARLAAAMPTVRGARFTPDAGRALLRATQIAGARSPESLADDEDYWGEIQRSFDLDRTLVNLNNGGVSPTPTHVLDAMIRDLKFSNELPVEHMWRVLEPRIESVRRELARELGCDTEELAIVRNASEANETVILGLDLQRGDEVIVTTQNYPRMLTAWDQRARREGIVVKQITFTVPPPSDDYIVERFKSAITPRTRAIELPHITNLTGQILPVRKIVDMARPLGIEVVVDGAHAFAHFPFTRDALGCDYYGTSLHKWLLAPVGTGFLYVRREKIPKVWPLMAAGATQTADIRKFEEIGTHPAANHNAIAAALAFHRSIGAERKAARLRWLRDRWAKRLLAESDRVKVLTPIAPAMENGKPVHKAGAIGFVNVDGIPADKLGGWLASKHRIVSTPMMFPEFQGTRITPNIYTTPQEVDFFADCVLSAVKSGIV